MHEMRPAGTGLALALTAGIIYPLCAVVFLLWPAGAFAFLGALFHGLDFSAMSTAGGGATTWRVFLAFCGSVVIAFVVGAVYAWMNNLVRGLFFRTPGRQS